MRLADELYDDSMTPLCRYAEQRGQRRCDILDLIPGILIACWRCYIDTLLLFNYISDVSAGLSRRVPPPPVPGLPRPVYCATDAARITLMLLFRTKTSTFGMSRIPFPPEQTPVC